MAIVQEHIALTEDEDFITMEVRKRDGETYWRDYAIIDIEVERMHSFTPDEVIDIADKMKAQAERIKKTYDKNGNKI